MNATDIKLYDSFRKDLNVSNAKAKIFAKVVNETILNEVDHKQTIYKSQNKEDLLKLEKQFNPKIEQSKSNLIKWFFAFFNTLVLMILGLYAKNLLK